jgi:hypothetical protein
VNGWVCHCGVGKDVLGVFEKTSAGNKMWLPSPLQRHKLDHTGSLGGSFCRVECLVHEVTG